MSPIPGTTRDSLEVILELAGQKVSPSRFSVWLGAGSPSMEVSIAFVPPQAFMVAAEKASVAFLLCGIPNRMPSTMSVSIFEVFLLGIQFAFRCWALIGIAFTFWMR